MKRLLLFIAIVLGLVSNAQDIIPRPNPPRLVNDAAGVLTADQVQALERKLVAYDDSTSTQIVLVIVQSLNGASVEDYALKVLRDWGVGNKKTNNGIVLLAAIADRKVRIEVGYGMEGAIPDVIAGQIIKSQIGPSFREGNYYRGFDEATDAIFQAAAGEYKAPEGYDKRGSRGGSALGVVIIMFIIIVFILSRGGGRGGGGGMMSRRGVSPWIALSLLDSFTRGGGGGGGGGWSGGGGGGGFGGFGGGSGGGGGASGSW